MRADLVEGKPRAAGIDRVLQAPRIETFEPTHEREEFVDPHAGIERHLLGNVADASARLQALLDDIEARHRRPARAGVQIAGQDAQNGRLTRPVRAEQPEHIAGAGFERDVVHPEPATVTLGEMLRDDDRRHEQGT